MTFRRFAALLALLLAMSACAAKKDSRVWKPGDSIICPHCGREFTVPEKVGQ